MASSLCPGCGEHAFNYITRTCEKCGDKYINTSKADILLLRELFKALGPLRDALALMVAENFVDYPRGCTCTERDTTPPGEGHKEICPASKYAERYLEHLFRRKQEREAQAKIEEHQRQQAEAIRRALHGGAGEEEVELTPEQIKAMDEKLSRAGFTSQWAEEFGRITTPEQAARFIHHAIGGNPEDLRQRCPECNGPMKPDGDVHVVCEPCGVRLIYDVRDAEVPGTRDVEVWHCKRCDQCYTFRRIDIAPRAVVLAGDDVPPTRCFACGGVLEQWTCYRPLVPTFERTPDDGTIFKRPMRALEADESEEIREEYLEGRFGVKADPVKVSGPDEARVVFGDGDEDPN